MYVTACVLVVVTAECTSVVMFMLSGSLASYMMLIGAFSLSVHGVVFLGVMLLVGVLFMGILCIVASWSCTSSRPLVALSDVGYAGTVVIVSVGCVCCGWLGLAFLWYGMAKCILAVDSS